MTRAELLEVVYRFYPRGVPSHDPAYDTTAEHLRLVEASRRALAAYPTWEAMIDRLADRYSLTNESLHILAGWVDPAYSAHIDVPGHTLGFHVCFLGPYYGIHRPGDPSEEPAASDIAREIEAAYPGYQPIPPELGNEVVPEVDGPRLGPATIYDCLLSETWGRHPFAVP